MKKTLSLILALVLCLSLCACTTNSRTTGANSTNTLTEEEKGYVGSWKPTTGSEATLKLYEDGVCIYRGANFDHGVWDIRDNQIVLRLADGHYVLIEILDNNTLRSSANITYERQN